MWLRFTAFLNYSNKEIPLYLVQERPGLPSFTVYAKSDEPLKFNLLKDGEKDWTIFPQDVPAWIRDIQRGLTDLVEEKLNVNLSC